MIKSGVAATTFPGYKMNNPGARDRTGLSALEAESFSDNIVDSLERVLSPRVERPLDVEYAKKAWQLVRGSANNPGEMLAEMVLFFEDYPEYTPVDLLIKGAGPQMTYLTFLEIIKLIETRELAAESLERAVSELADDLKIDPETLTASIRVAIVGRNSTLPLFAAMELLGEKRLRDRICDAMRSLTNLHR
ncbi:MAG TPA: hypothetical protein VF318_00105 [Dehalococcoidales bacterium]